MVAFDQEKGRFNYRVAGVAIHNGRVLLDRNTRNNYWVLPGGHPDLMETMACAVRREISEEIQAEVEVVRLLWIAENFFRRSKSIHELSFYFQIEIDPKSRLLTSDGPFYGMEHHHTLIFQWFPIEEVRLKALPLLPPFLPEALTHIPSTPQHLVFDEIARPCPEGLG